MNKFIKINNKYQIYRRFNNYIISDVNSLNIDCIDYDKIRSSFNMLKIDKYHNNNIGPPTRLRKYFNIDIDMTNV